MDALLRRITYVAEPDTLTPIPWPDGLAPTVSTSGHEKPPAADVLVLTYTAAEAQALADVLTPGLASSAWTRYAEDWSKYEHQLTERSPARDSKCLGLWALTNIGSKTVVLFKSDLHLATDASSLPIRQLWGQLIAAVKPSLILTTGTAGGIGAETQLGDVCVTNGAKFNCRDTFKTAPFAQQSYIGPAWSPGPRLQASGELLAANASRLQPVATRAPEITTVIGEPGVETVDYFGFADATDAYGIVAHDAYAHTEEMDDAVLPLALSTAHTHSHEAADSAGLDIPWVSIRNASDPQVAHMASLEAEKEWAEHIYERYGYWTTIGSAIACWAVIADA
jgi:nucleoside phosphorylase